MPASMAGIVHGRERFICRPLRRAKKRLASSALGCVASG